MRPLAVMLVMAGSMAPAIYAAESKGVGEYGHMWTPEPVFEYWDPEAFGKPAPVDVEGVFQGEECVECHESVTPGIVNGWRKSRHASPKDGKPVYCGSCHGADHRKLYLPTPEVCSKCHEKQHAEFVSERRLGFPSHALAMERAVDARHFADKPKAEVASCLNCHSVATKCDSCHTRHRFSAAEARRPEACVTCHSGPPHPDDEAYFASSHGKLYLDEGAGWDWTKPLAKGNYKAPTCAYCHMRGRHTVAENSVWKFGLVEVNPETSTNQVKRARWISICEDCHDRQTAVTAFKALDRERKAAWEKLYAMESLLRDLRSENAFKPGPRSRPPYPASLLDSYWPLARIGYYEGQASAFYNVSAIERMYFEMWYFSNLAAYKGAAHGAAELAESNHRRMDRQTQLIYKEAERLRNHKEIDPGALWLEGEYTQYNLESN